MSLPAHADSRAAPEARLQAASVAPSVALLAVVGLVLHALALGRYGYAADELYYLDAVRHLDWGFVEFSPLSIALLAGWRGLVGESVAAIRIVPVLCGTAVVLLTGRLAKVLGGGTRAQGLAALAVVVSPMSLVFHHYFSPNALDHVLWLVAALLLLDCLARAETRRWLLLGLVLGLGLQNRLSVVWLMAGIAIGLVATRHRRVLARRGPWLAALVAVALFTPYLVWQAVHGWPVLEFVDGMRVRKVGVVTPPDLLTAQLLVMHPVLVPLGAAGIAWLVLSPAGRPFAPLAIVYLTTMVILATARTSKAYYPAPAFPFLYAAGAVACERAVDRCGRPWLFAAGAAVIAVAGLVTLPLTLPLLPVEVLIAYQRLLRVPVPTVRQAPQGELSGYFAGMQEWPQILDRFGAIVDGLAPDERAAATIFTEEYAEAAVVNVLGRARGLPPAVCGHDSYALWGTGGASGRVLVTVGLAPERVASWYADVRSVGTIGCRRCPPLRAEQPITVAREPRGDFAAFFAAMRHLE